MSASIHRIVIGTAGHIDHGKSTLVRALTGIDPDRLPEEKERGLTIDLGFAPWKLADGTRVGFVDVPGHERFVKNMVAGATGIDFVILVIAADDGIMPQTREHLEIMQILGVRRGLVAMTKVDLAEKEYADLLEEDIRALVRGTFLESAPIFRIAATAGTGMEAFRSALETLVRATPPRPAEGVFRMPIQRVFSSPGHGTVVTGIPLSGSAAIGDRIEILPLGKTGKIRGIHAYKEKTERAQAGHSSALNLSDIDFAQIHRGMVAAAPGVFRASPIVEAHLQILAREKKPILDLTAVRLHVGTCEALGTLVLLDRKSIAGGEQAYVQIRLGEPVVVAPGDRFVLRLETPPVTVGGGVIVGESGRKLKRFREEVIEDLSKKEESLASRASAIAYALERRGVAAASVEELMQEIKIPRDALLAELVAAEKADTLLAIRPNELYLHRVGAERARKSLREALAAFFRENPARLAADLIPIRERAGLSEVVLDFALREEAKSGALSFEKGQIRLAGQKATLPPQWQSRKEALLALLRKQPFAPPTKEEAATAVGCAPAEIEKLLSLLRDEGHAFRAGDFHFSAEAIAQAREAIVANIQKHGELDIPSLRDRLGTSRKYLIPLLELFDSQGLTLRQGGRRILRKS